MNCCLTSTSPEERGASAKPSIQPIYVTSEEGAGNTTNSAAAAAAAKKAVYPSMYNGHFSKLLISHEQIKERTKAIATLLSQQYDTYTKTQPLVLVCILKGSSPFYNMLCSELSSCSTPYITEFIRVKSYVGNTSSGNVKMYHVDMPKSITGRNVIVVEDIVDTGMTLSAIMPKFYDCSPESVQVCTLLEKRLDNHRNQNGGDGSDDKIVPKYVGFSIPDEFVIGFGLDYNEMYRDLRDIWVLGQKGIDFGGYSD
mmetsp:Transcript_7040/g.10732  ORF Transcript_7040/g.10732 Transcript_7040/m.10732 type:complete len:255 (+) Transcript_7040:203-967(+)